LDEQRSGIVGGVWFHPARSGHKKVAELSATVVQGVGQLFKYEIAHGIRLLKSDQKVEQTTSGPSS